MLKPATEIFVLLSTGITVSDFQKSTFFLHGKHKIPLHSFPDRDMLWALQLLGQRIFCFGENLWVVRVLGLFLTEMDFKLFCLRVQTRSVQFCIVS